MHQTVNIILDADEKAEIGDIFDFTLNFGSNRIFINQVIPRVGFNLFHAQRNAAFFRINA